jgi:hypothetical protein
MESTDRQEVKQVSELFDGLRASGKSSEDIFVILYSDLKQLARKKVGRQPAGASMHATRLLSDLYMRLFGKKSPEFQWESAKHFFNTMALAMEQLLIDHARQFKSIARGRSQTDSLDALAENGFQPSGGRGSAPSGKNLLRDNVEQAVAVKVAGPPGTRLCGRREGRNRATSGRHRQVARLCGSHRGGNRRGPWLQFGDRHEGISQGQSQARQLYAA